jgi:hypothetical protein
MPELRRCAEYFLVTPAEVAFYSQRTGEHWDPELCRDTPEPLDDNRREFSLATQRFQCLLGRCGNSHNVTVSL